MKQRNLLNLLTCLTNFMTAYMLVILLQVYMCSGLKISWDICEFEERRR